MKITINNMTKRPYAFNVSRVTKKATKTEPAIIERKLIQIGIKGGTKQGWPSQVIIEDDWVIKELKADPLFIQESGVDGTSSLFVVGL